MSLECLAKKGEDLFSIPPAERNGVWAYNLNNLRREILFRIIQVFPSTKEVRVKAIPIFYMAIEALNSLTLTPPNPQDSLAHYIPGFLENFQEGVKKLEEYLDEFQVEDKVCC